ncbi:HD-GYP domain-containing protein [Pseudoalteromonas denitrificans]
MFVNNVIKQSGSVKIKNQGWVRTQSSINNLIHAGILEVEIDSSKTIEEEIKAPATPELPAKTEKHDPTHASVSMENEIGKAKKLYGEAKELQNKAFDNIKAGRKIEITPFKEVANGFIDSIFRNQDALACITRIREKDAYLLEHSINVSVLMTIFAKHLHIDRDIIHELATGALLHDIGKIKIKDNILNKPGKFTESEFDEMKNHARYSKESLEEAGLSGIAVEIAGYHHERLDGKGYPYGLKGDEISQYVRMISIVDVYDALTAKRIYKDDMSPIKAFKILKSETPESFDTELLNQFIACIGIHPVGTLVKLTSQKLGIVSKSNFEKPLKPWVKIFYSAKHHQHTPIKDINLAKKSCTDEIESSVKPEDFNIELMRFLKTAFLN